MRNFQDLDEVALDVGTSRINMHGLWKGLDICNLDFVYWQIPKTTSIEVLNLENGQKVYRIMAKVTYLHSTYKKKGP